MEIEKNTPSIDESAEETKRQIAGKPKKQNSFWEIVKFTGIALLIVIPIRIFIAQPFVVSGESMVPTFENGDYLIVDEISYRLSEPKRGDVMVFRYPLQPDRFFIKRAIGLPGETVTLKNGVITIENSEYPEGFDLEEVYIDADTTGTANLTLGEDEYFVMGDNRGASSDSRVWGALDKSFIVGRALVRLLPLKHIDLLPGNVDLTHNTEEE